MARIPPKFDKSQKARIPLRGIHFFGSNSAAGFDSGIRFNYEQKYSENKNEFNQNTNQLYKNHAICDTKIIYFTTL